MQIKTKLLFWLALLATLPMLVAIAIATWVAGDSSNALLVAKTQETLVRIRDTKKRQVEASLNQVSQQIINFSQRPIALEMMQDLEEGFLYYADEVTEVSVDEARSQLTEYYKQQESLFVNRIDRLSDSAILLQYNYIANNNYDHREKQKLDKVIEPTLYSKTHGNAHPQIRRYLEENEIYDIYLVSLESDEIIYSFRKENDLGAVITGPQYESSEIGRAYAAAKSAQEKDFVYISDYSPYAASENRQSLFVATTVTFLNAPVGVLIFQYQADFVNRIMSSNNAWKQVGLGETGDAYLVGADKTIRSERRAFMEDPEVYISTMQATEGDTKIATIIRASGTMIGNQFVDTISVARADQGESGFARYVDSQGNGILSAYAPLQLPGLNWKIIVEMTEKEAQAPSDSLIQRLIIYSIGTALIMTLIAVISGWLFTLRLIQPVERLASEIDYIETNSDLSFRLSAKPSDITQQIVGSMNKMLLKIQTIVGKVATSSDTLSEAAANIDLLCIQTYQGIEKQGAETKAILAEIRNMIEATQQMAINVDKASQAVSVASEHAYEGQKEVDSTSRSVGKLNNEVNHAVSVIDELAKNSTTVGGVVEVINGIAEQTNLLALNAAIEAARAGELGRGFAVVADEVRTLASRTQASTEEIKSIVGTLNNCASDAVKAMSRGREQGEKSVSRASHTNVVLANIVESNDQVATINQQIEDLSKQQQDSTQLVDERISMIREIAKDNTDAAEQTKNASNKINQLTKDLKNAVAEFKLSS